MAIIEVKEKSRGGGNVTHETRERNYTRTFHVLCDDFLADAAEIRDAAGVPALLDPYKDPDDNTIDTSSVVTGIDTRQDEQNPALWIVTVNYTGTNFAGIPWKVEYDSQKFEEACSTAYIGAGDDPDTVTNSALEPYDPPLTRDDCRPVLRLTKNVATFNPAWIKTYSNKLNNGNVVIDGVTYTQYQLKINYIKAIRHGFNTDTYYWEVTIEIEIKEDGWLTGVLDQGYSKLVDGVRVPFRNKGDGSQTAKPKLLDGGGSENISEPLVPVYNYFRLYKQVDFAPLDLDYNPP